MQCTRVEEQGPDEGSGIRVGARHQGSAWWEQGPDEGAGIRVGARHQGSAWWEHARSGRKGDAPEPRLVPRRRCPRAGWDELWMGVPTSGPAHSSVKVRSRAPCSARKWRTARRV